MTHGEPPDDRSLPPNDNEAEKDCLAAFRRVVSETGLFETGRLDEIAQDARRLVDEAVAEAVAAPAPGPEDLMTDVYVTY